MLGTDYCIAMQGASGPARATDAMCLASFLGCYEICVLGLLLVVCLAQISSGRRRGIPSSSREVITPARCHDRMLMLDRNAR